MINNKHLCDGNYISVYFKPSSDKTIDQVVKLFEGYTKRGVTRIFSIKQETKRINWTYSKQTST
jgi:hypothetical protein